MNTFFAPLFSSLYRHVRGNIIDRVHANQALGGRPHDLEEVVEIGDKKLKALPRWTYAFPIPEGIGVQFHDLYFPSPLTLAAFKDDLSIIDIWMHLGLGGACVETVVKRAHEGNSRPRLQEVTVNGHKGLLNAMGLPCHGVERKIREFEQSKVFSHSRPIGISIGGSSLDEYQQVFDKVNNYMEERQERWHNTIITLAFLQGIPIPNLPQIPYYLEINVSCPNTPEGQQMTKHPRLLEELVRYMRSKTKKVVGVKFSPDTSDKELIDFAEMLMSHENVYMNLGNTTKRSCEAVGLSSKDMSLGHGGLSGPALYTRTKQMVEMVAPTDIAICATGGIDSAEKVLALQGIARENDIPLIVGMATAIVKDMYCIPRINRELAKK